jgi:aquaporin Z
VSRSPRRLPWTEAAIEAGALGLFLVSACVFGALLEHPASPVRAHVSDATVRRAVMGVLMGLTAVALIYSPWGRRSGAHMNPSVTLAFLTLGRMSWRSALAYVPAQFAGAVAGVAVSALVVGPALGDPPVRYVATVPGPGGAAPAFVAEFAISFALMSTVLLVTRHPRLDRFAGVVAGALVALWILVEAPLSGMSMNPARSFGSALFARDWTAFWVYLTAPPLAMVTAALLHAAGPGRAPSPTEAGGCAKLDHPAGEPCLFCEERGIPGSPPDGPAIHGRATGEPPAASRH